MKTDTTKANIEAVLPTLSKRARAVVEHILKHGHITTKEIAGYGYDHPPRAVRDTREAGIPIRTTMIIEDGKRMGSYSFVDAGSVEAHKIGGRKTFSKSLRKSLIGLYKNKCAICGESYEDRYFQIDHRVPYEVSGDTDNPDDYPERYMPICGTCNRQKSWSCEHCSNWGTDKNSLTCTTCYWGSPEKYEHVALKKVRRLTLVWEGHEIAIYNNLNKRAHQDKSSLQEFIKSILSKLHA